MAVFVLVRVTRPEPMAAAVKSVFPNSHYQLPNNEWLISAEGTAKEISDRLGITGENAPAGSAIVLKVATYFGRAPTEIWDWLKAGVESGG